MARNEKIKHQLRFGVFSTGCSPRPCSRSVVVSFPKASERRVLLKAEVCYTSSHVHIFTSSHTHIFTSSQTHNTHTHIFLPSQAHILHIFTSSSYLHILTSSHLHTSSHLLSVTSSYPHIFTHLHTSSLSLSCPLSQSLSFFFFSKFFFSRPQGVPTRRHNIATLSHEMRFGCHFFAILLCGGGGNPFARNEVRVSKAEDLLRACLVQRWRFRLVCKSVCV